MKEYLNEDNLGSLLEYLYPNSTWVHNQAIPDDITEARSKINNLDDFKKRDFQPNYRNEEDSIIVEYYNITHYQNSNVYWSDVQKVTYYRELGYKLVQIPYFVQPTKEIIKLYFRIEIDIDLTEESNGFNTENGKINKNLPSSFSEDGVRRFMVEFQRFDNVVQEEIMSTLYENYRIEEISLKILPLSLIKFLNFQVTNDDEKFNGVFELDNYPKYLRR